MPLVGRFRGSFEELFSHNLMSDTPTTKHMENVYKIFSTLIFSLTPFPVKFYERGYFCSSSNQAELLFFQHASKNLVYIPWYKLSILCDTEDCKEANNL